MADATRWVTYDQLASALGIAPDSARRLVARKRWARQTGNDGKARIEVPTERLTPDSPPDVTQDTSLNVLPDDRKDVAPDDGPVVQAMARHLEHVEKHLEEMRAERDAERARAVGLADRLGEVQEARAALEGQVEALKGILSERDQEVSRGRDRVVEITTQLLMATAQAVEAADMQGALRGQLEATAAELQELRSRPWWRRIAG